MARPELRDAARFALYAERLMPTLQDDEAILNVPVPHKDPVAAGRVAIAKLRAQARIPALRGLLYPEDDDG